MVSPYTQPAAHCLKDHAKTMLKRMEVLLVVASLAFVPALVAQAPNPGGRAIGAVPAGHGVDDDLSRPARAKYLQLPLAFEKQQAGGREEFVSRGQGYTLALQGGKASIAVKPAEGPAAVVSFEFAGGRTPDAVPGEELPGKVNLIYGNDPRMWKLGLPTYGKVTYRDVYPGTDVVYYGNQSQLEFDLVLKAGADPDAIRMKVGGARKLSVDASGALVIGDGSGDLRVALPRIYQEAGGTRKNISGHYAIHGRDEVAFSVDPYDRSRELVIDPTIVYSTLLGGGTNTTVGEGIALDSSGNMYVTGYTYAQDFPTANALQGGLTGGSNGFVTKINAAGTALIYSTYLGGSSYDFFQGIAVDSTGAAWVTGYTQSSDFPVLNAAQSTYGGGTDAFVARLTAAGALQFSTFLGGSSYDSGQGIAVDSSNNGFVTGQAGGSFPTTAGAFQQGSGTTFVTKYSPAGAVAYSTLMGSFNTYSQAIAVDSTSNAYITGHTYDSPFPGAPTGGAQASNMGNGDAFVAKLNPGATALVYFTFLGGTNFDRGTSIKVDSGQNAYIAGYTSSTGLATGGASQTALAGGQNGFIAKLNPAGTAFTYITYLGGNRQDSINGLAVDSFGNAYVAGYTDSNVFPSVAALQSLPGNGTSLFQTTNSGALWSAFDSNIPGAVYDISQNPGSPNTIVVSTEQGIYRTVNGGASWTSEPGPSYATLSRSPANASTIYASGGSNSWQSTNDGVTWNLTGSLPCCGVNGILADPLNANVAYAFGNNLGVYVTTNGGTSWSAAAGLPSTQVQAMAAGSDGSVYAGLPQFGIYKTTNQGAAWTAINTGFLGFIYPGAHSIAVSPSNPAILYFAWGQVYKSTNGGASWSYLSGVPNAGISQIEVSATNPSVVYAAAYNGQVFVSNDGGVTWTAASTGLTAQSLNEIAIDPTNGAHVFAVASVSQTAFVAELNTSGNGLIYSTYLGGQNYSYAYGIAVNGVGTAFVTGYASGNQGFPVTSSTFGSNTSYSAFVTSISNAAAGCSFAVSPESSVENGYAQSLTFGVVAPSGCIWAASSSQSWATISKGTSGTGTGNISVQLAQNSGGTARTAMLTIGNQSVIITQASSSCNYSLSQYNVSQGTAGGPVSVNVTTGAGCPWSVTNNYGGAITVTSGASGTGNGTVNLSVGANDGLNARTFRLSIGTNQLTVTQSGTCTFTLNPTSATFTAAGGTGSVGVTPSSGACTWNASSNVPWITVTGGFSGTGNGTVNYSVAASNTAAQSGTIAIGGMNFSVTQAAGPVSMAQGPSLGTFTTGTQQIALGGNAGNGTYTWSLVSGLLPPGLALRTDTPSYFASNQQAGLIGVATTPGTYSFTLSVTSAGQTVTQADTIRITALNLKDNAISIPDAFASTPYSYTFTAVNGAGPVTFTATGSLPPGLTLSSAGVLSGSPTTPGFYNLNFSIFDGVDTVFRGQGLNVYAVNITSPAVLPNATQNGAYSTPLTASGGTGPYTFSAFCCLPNGLTLAGTGTISGTVNAGPGKSSFYVTVTDANGVTYRKYMSIDVVGTPPAQMRISTYGTFFNDAVEGDTYGSGVYVCCGGTAPYAWTATGLPPGMSIHTGAGVTSQYVSPGDAEIWGIPQTAGTYNVQFTVTDAAGATTTQTFPLNVSAIDSDYPPSGTINTPYSTIIRALGGKGPYTATLLPGSQLPDGLTFNGTTLQLSGTPLESGNFNLIVRFADSTSPNNTLLRNAGLNIGASSSTTINIYTQANLGTFAVGGAPSLNLYACCVASDTWALAGGALPPGQSLSAGGQLTGTLSTAGTYKLLVKVTDASNSANAAFRQFTEIVTLTPISITTGSLPYGNVGTAYSQSLAATGGTGTLTWTLNSFNYLPPGLTLASNGTIGGTPTATGQFYFTVTVTDTAGNTNSRGYSINIYAAGAAPPLGVMFGTNFGTFTTGTQQIGLGASGGNGTYTWSLVSGSLPPGLALRTDTPSYFGSNQQAGLIGVATAAGTYNFTLKVTSGGQSFTQATSMRVTALNLKDNAISIPDAFANTPYSYAFTALNGAGPVTFTATNTLPPGLTLSSAGVLSGTPTTPGYYNLNFSIGDGVDTVYRGQGLNVYTVNITTSGALPNATQNGAYSTTLAASGGAGGYVFTASCCLPSGLTLGSDGTISGTVTAGPGLSQLNVTVTDRNGVSYTKTVSIDVVGAPPALMEVYGYQINDPVVGDPDRLGVYFCCGGTAPFTWTATGLPPGMSIHYGAGVTSQYITPGDAEIWGIPQAVGNYNVQFTVTDATGATTSQTFPLHVSALDSDYPQNGTINVPYSTTLRVLGGTGPYSTTQLAGTQLPDGLTFNTGTDLLSGTPLETSGNFSLNARFSDSAGNTLTRSMGVYIAGSGLTTIYIYNGSTLGPSTVGSAPSFTLSACCVPSYAWSVVSGTLPPGQTLSSSGLLSGTLTTAGTYTFLVMVADPANSANNAFRQFIETVTPISITTFSLPYGNLGSAYSTTLSASGGSGSLTWTLNSFNYLPPGLTLSSGGAIGGTPTSAGQYYFNVTVTDGAGNTNTRGYSINVYAAGAAPPLILNFGPNPGPVSVGPFQFGFSASGGMPPYHYSLTPGATPIPGMRVQDGPPLPQGFNTAGAFIGVVTEAGTYNSSIRVTDSLENTFDRAITLTVSPVELLDQGTLPMAVAGTPYSFTLTPYGGSGNYVWAGSNLPAGLSINTSGQITGTPASGAGNFFFTLELADAATPTSMLHFGFNITVNPFAITDAGVLPQAMSGVVYSYTFNAPGCGTGCVWSIVNGGLPSGLTLSGGGVLSGTATQSGFNQTVTIQASGSNGASQKVFSLTIPPTSIQGLSITTAITTSTVVGGTMAMPLSATGGAPPYVFSLASGNLPTGVTVQGPGETLGLSPGVYYLAGRSVQTGTYSFTLKVTDSANNTATKAFSWLISPMTIGYPNLPVNGNPLIYNTPYSQPMLVLGGTGNYTSWTTSAPVYPGLSVNAASGLITGAPTNTGPASTLWTVTDSGGNTLNNNVSIDAASNVSTTVQLFGGPPAGAVVPTFGVYFVSAYGGAAPYTITPLTPLPPGVFLQPDVGSDLILIFPQSAGALTFTLQVKDSNGVTGARTYSVTATDFNASVPGSLPDGSVGVPYSQPLVVLGSASPVWAVAAGSALPAGLSVSAGGVISGTPTATGNYSFILTLTDATGSESYTVTLRVSSLAIAGPATLPVAVAGTAYTQLAPLATMTAAAGSGLTWTATGLPGGMSITPAGLIIGVPGSAGQFSVTFTVTDGVSPMSRAFQLYVRQANPTQLDYPIAGATLPDAVLNRVYFQSLLPDGGAPPYTWSVAAGSALPPGLSLTISGTDSSLLHVPPGTTVLLGQPSAAGHYTFSLTATDSASSQVTRTFTLNVTPLSLSQSLFGLPRAIVGTPYSQQLAISGGTAPYTFILSATSPAFDTLPPNLTMSSSGLISGTPTSTGIYEFKVTVTDAAGQTLNQSLTLTSTAPSGLYFNAGSLYGLYVGHGFMQLVTTGGGSSPEALYTSSVSSGTLPPGVTAGGVFQGVPSAPGIYTFTLRVTDTSNASNFAEHTYTTVVSSMQLLTPGQGGETSLGLPAGQAGSPYSYAFGVAGGTGPYTFTESPLNPLPPGLTLSAAGVLSGTPQQTGVFNLSPIVTDAAGSANQLTYSGAIPLVITPAGKAAPLITNPFGDLPSASLDAPYIVPLDRLVSGGTPPYTWADPAATLPSGLAIYPGANGVSSFIGGIPTAPGLSAAPISLLVSDSGGQSLTVSLRTLEITPLALTPDSIPPGMVGTPYSVSFVFSGGTAPYSLGTRPNSDMPAGLTLNAAGVLSGTPTSAGNYVILLVLQDNAGNSLSRNYRITIDNAAGQAPAIGIAPKPVNVYYVMGSPSPSIPLSIGSTSGTPAFNATFSGIAGSSLSATGGTTPATLNLNLSAAPLAQGTYFGVAAVASSSTVNRGDAVPVVLTVAAPPPCTYSLNPSSATISSAGGTGSFNISAGAGCAWSATASDPSVTITSATTGSGNATISYSVVSNATSAEIDSTITVAGQTYSLAQFAPAGCSYGIVPASISATAPGGTAQIKINASDSSCVWTATGLGVSPASGTGSGTVTVTIPAKGNAGAQVLNATIAGQTFTANQTGADCTVSLNSTSASIAAGGATGAINVTTPGGCAYSTVLGPSWISVVSGASGTGPGTLTYSVDPNSTTVSRSGALTIGGTTFTIAQQALACSITLDTSSLGSPFASAGGSGTIGITTNGSNCAWAASTGASWATVLPAAGTGSGTVSVTTNAANPAPAAVTGKITIAGQSIGISQGGITCAYNLRSTSGTVPASGGAGSVGVVAASGCAWTSIGNDTSWLTITSTGSSGTGSVQFVASPNMSALPQVGTLTIAGLTYTVTEAGAPCSFSLAQPGVNVGADGTATNQTLSFTAATAACTVTPVSYSSWIHVIGSSLAGTSGTLTYSVDANASGSLRTGSIQVGDRLFAVSQTGAACAFSLSGYGAVFGQSGGSASFLGSPSAIGCTPVTGVTQPTIVTLGPLTGPVLDIFTQPYSVNVFNSVTNAVRIGAITFGGQVFTVKQTSW